LQEIRVWPPGTTNVRLLAAIGVPRLLAALVARDDTPKKLRVVEFCGSANEFSRLPKGISLQNQQEGKSHFPCGKVCWIQ